MSWIKKHWGETYIARAESNILQLVCLAILFLNRVSSSAFKMKDYRAKLAADEDGDQLSPVDIANATGHGRGYEAYLDIDAQYGIEEDMETDNASTVNEQSVEQEYVAYTTAVLLGITVNILKYWEVIAMSCF